jgi:hypothetical protein
MDLSKLSDEELRRMAGRQETTQRSVRDLSDDELRALAQPEPGMFDTGLGRGVKDVAIQAPAGVAYGTLGMFNLPRMARDAVEGGVRLADSGFRSLFGMDQLSPQEQKRREIKPSFIDSGLDAAKSAMDANIPKPQTMAGEYAKTVGEFIPGALLGPGGAFKNAILYGVAPGVASETAGQLTKGTSLEPWARGAAALTTGLGMAALQRPSSAQSAIERMAGGSIPRAELEAADRLMTEAAQRGLPLTPVEALNQVTSGRYNRLAQSQRLVENSEGGDPVMGQFMSQRPGQVQQAGLQAFDQLAPNPALPGQTGIAVRNAASGTIDDTQSAINAATRPAYQASEAARLAPQDFARFQADPLFARILGEIRGNPALNRTIANLPDDSVGTIDLVQRILRERGQNAALPGQASTSNTMAANFESARAPLMQAAETATGGPTGSYATARAAQERMRGRYLEPLTEGQIGTLSGTADVGRQTTALFPSRPQAGSSPEVAQTVSLLVRKDPKAATDLVGQHARTIFAEATKNNATGANQFGGAKFAAQIRGNSEQAASLDAAIRALPNGDVRAQGFGRFLDVLEATGQRFQKGSPTAFNQTMTQELESGALVRRGLTTGGVGIFRDIGKRWDQYQLSGKTEAIAKLLTNSDATRLFGRIAKENGPTPAAKALVLKLLTIAGNTAKAPGQANSNPVPNVR